MSALDDGPAHVLRSPCEHYEEADRLLHEVAHSRDQGLPFVRRKIERAQVHAMLAQVPGVINVTNVNRLNGILTDETGTPVEHPHETVTATTTNERL